MHIESVTLTNFRCFGPGSHTVTLDSRLTACVGVNGAGKTALMQALLRLFGTHEQRRVLRQDFHVPPDEVDAPAERTLAIDVIFAFPELQRSARKPVGAHSDDDASSSVPSFFLHMGADEGGALRFRLRLDATWMDDGSDDGAVDEKVRSIQTFKPSFDETTECQDVGPLDRARIQMIYIPASRDPVSRVTSFLRGRLWRAIMWSDAFRETLQQNGTKLNDEFGAHDAVIAIADTLRSRWQFLYSAGTDSVPFLRPVDLRFERFIRRVEVGFRPDEAGRDRGLDELSDGQRSLFYVAMTAAALDIEKKLETEQKGFNPDTISLPALTILAIEEPENNLAPFYLSRVIRQVQDLTETTRVQAVLSSHSASILGRVEPTQVRHFRLAEGTRTAIVSQIKLPGDLEDASKFVREAVRTYPELYFARFVILGEGSSEEVVLPRLAEAMGLDIDPSFVAIVPLGGRHVNHLWRLLNDLNIPFATLLDLDDGRKGGGWARIKTAYLQLAAIGKWDPQIPVDEWKKSFDERVAQIGGGDHAKELQEAVNHLRSYSIFFCDPLDLDMSMLCAFPDEYRVLESGMDGPSSKGGVIEAVLKEGDPEAYDLEAWEDEFRWYRYLFLTRGKPGTHVRVLSQIDDMLLANNAPGELKALLTHVAQSMNIGLASKDS